MNSPDKPTARDLAKPAYFALETQRIVQLLRDFQAKKVHLAIITDEFGSVRGLASLEDVLEEIVGEINDESDQPETSWLVVAENTIVADAKIDLEEVEEYFQDSPARRPLRIGGRPGHPPARPSAGGQGIGPGRQPLLSGPGRHPAPDHQGQDLHRTAQLTPVPTPSAAHHPPDSPVELDTTHWLSLLQFPTISRLSLGSIRAISPTNVSR